MFPRYSLVDTAKGDRTGLTPAQLIDPWGNQYHLAVPSTHNNIEGFDIWTVPPVNVIGRKVIGNGKMRKSRCNRARGKGVKNLSRSPNYKNFPDAFPFPSVAPWWTPAVTAPGEG